MGDRRSRDLNYSRGRRGRPYQRERARCFAVETHCRKCGKPVDKTLPYRDPRTGRVNIWSKTYGHTDELDSGGHPYRGHLEHLHCNSSAGATYGNAKRTRTDHRKAQRVAPDTPRFPGPHGSPPSGSGATSTDTSADWS